LFADIFDRNSLHYQTREIATIAALASLSGAEAQLGSHLNVGKNTGPSQQQLRSIEVWLGAKVFRQAIVAKTVIIPFHKVFRLYEVPCFNLNFLIL